MRRLLISCVAASLSIVAQMSWASPKQLITHNLTDLDVNALVAGTIPSPYPTKAHSDGKVNWAQVRITCVGHTVDNWCPALVRIGHNTPNPIDIGTVEINLNSGVIRPNELQAHGYRMIVNGVAESTIMHE